jgi:hypothetical protein
MLYCIVVLNCCILKYGNKRRWLISLPVLLLLRCMLNAMPARLLNVPALVFVVTDTPLPLAPSDRNYRRGMCVLFCLDILVEFCRKVTLLFARVSPLRVPAPFTRSLP